MIRGALKGAVESALVGSGIVALARRRARGDRLILAYHNVVPDGLPPGGDASLHLPRSSFVAQLELLRRTHDIVPLDGLLLSDGIPPVRPRVAITFDDAYRGALAVAGEELARRGIPATFFVCPGRLGGQAFWWDAVAERDGSALTPLRREFFLNELRGEEARVRAWARAHDLREARLPDHARSASVTELDRIAALPGISLAAHSWSHPNLARLSPEELMAELERPLAWLRARYPGALPWLAYPYGRWSPLVERLANEAGYVAALRVEGGGVRSSNSNPYALPRINVAAGLSANGLSLRCARIKD